MREERAKRRSAPWLVVLAILLVSCGGGEKPTLPGTPAPSGSLQPSESPRPSRSSHAPRSPRASESPLPSEDPFSPANPWSPGNPASPVDLWPSSGPSPKPPKSSPVVSSLRVISFVAPATVSCPNDGEIVQVRVTYDTRGATTAYFTIDMKRVSPTGKVRLPDGAVTLPFDCGADAHSMGILIRGDESHRTAQMVATVRRA